MQTQTFNSETIRRFAPSTSIKSLSARAAERAALDAAVAEHLAGGSIDQLPGYTQAPTPKRSSWIDPDARPKRKRSSARTVMPDDQLIELARRHATKGSTLTAAARLLHCSRDRLKALSDQNGIQFGGTTFRQLDDQFEAGA